MINPSSIACCCASASVDLQEILRRITPIDFFPGVVVDPDAVCPSQKGILLVDSNEFINGQLAFPTCDGLDIGTVIDGNGVSANNIIATDVYAGDSVFVGETQITSSGTTLELPADTTVGGVPIGGASIQYFQLQICPTNGQQSNLPSTSAGDYIVGGFFQNGYLSYVQYVYYWPCLFSTNAKIVSMAFYMNVAADALGLPITANNFVAELRIRNQNGTIINTGQTITYAPMVANNTSYYVSIEGLSYPVVQGQRAGLYISWDGELATNQIYNYTWITYNIGFQKTV